MLTRTSTRPGTRGRRNVELLISDCCFTNSTPLWLLAFGFWVLEVMSLCIHRNTGTGCLCILGKGTSNIGTSNIGTSSVMYYIQYVICMCTRVCSTI